MRPTPHARQLVRGFTLVELLVVIGIIALLIGILLPTLGRAKENANRIACASNMRQFFYACMMYQTDNKTLPGPMIPCTWQFDKVVAAGNAHAAPYDPNNPTASTSNLWRATWPLPATATTRIGWAYQSTASPVMLYKYLGKGSVNVYRCPSNVDLFDRGTIFSSTYKGYNMGNGYRINNQSDTNMPYFFGYWGTASTYVAPPPQGTTNSWGWTNSDYMSAKRLSQVRSAGGGSTDASPGYIAKNPLGLAKNNLSLIWMLSDIDSWNFSTNTSDLFGIADGTIPLAQRFPQPVHKSGTVGRNYLYFDGHAQWQPFGTTIPYNGFNDPNGN